MQTPEMVSEWVILFGEMKNQSDLEELTSQPLLA